MSVRPLAVVVAAQLVLVAALVVWASVGFPLPGVIDGGSAARSAPPSANGAHAAQATTTGQPAPATVPIATVNRFDGPRAFALLREQVQKYGWRPAGSAALRRLAARLRGLLPHGHFEAIPGHPTLRNVVGVLPGRRPAIVLGAHYDVVPKPVGFVGANDGAAGTAAVVELARDLARAKRPRNASEIRFVLFDGEEAPVGCPDARFYSCALRGSRAYATAHAGQIADMVLLDYIAAKPSVAKAGTLSFPREDGSNPVLWAQLRTAAQAVGVGSLFPNIGTGFSIIDDDTPFTRNGIAAIDVIDWDFPPQHTLGDDLDAVSQRSLDAVGEATYRLMTRLRAGDG